MPSLSFFYSPLLLPLPLSAMSNPSQWTTTYSSVFRDRRKYEAPNAAPSDDSWNVRTQAYYGTRAALSEHATRTAEIEARTHYGQQAPNEAAAQRNFSPTSTRGLGAAGMNLSERSAQSSFSNSSVANYGPQGTSGYLSSTGGAGAPVAFASPNKDLWTHPTLPHTGVVQNNSPYTQRPVFSNGINNGYAGDVQFGSLYQQPQQSQQSNSPQHHIPGYGGFVRGAQFVRPPIALACSLLAPSLLCPYASRRTWLIPDLLLIVWLVCVRMRRLLWLWVNLQVHGDTFGKTTRNCLSVPTEVPLEP